MGLEVQLAVGEVESADPDQVNDREEQKPADECRASPSVEDDREIEHQLNRAQGAFKERERPTARLDERLGPRLCEEGPGVDGAKLRREKPDV